MKFETLLEYTSNIRSIKEKQLLYLERFVNDAKGEFGEYSDVDPKYSPRGGMRTFPAPYADVKKTRLKTYHDMPDRRLMEAIFQDEEARFVLHPETKSPFDSLDGSYVVSPSSSTRTLMTRELPYNFQAKTHLDKRHFRFIRRLRGSSVKHSVAVSKDIRKATESREIPFYGYLPESLGLVYGDLETGIGVIYRESIPRPLKGGHRFLIPYFSLYSKDPFSPADKPLLSAILERNADGAPLEYFVDVIVGRILETWVWFVRERGLLPELHGQNTLLELTANGVPTRIIHRDFQSMYSDSAIRAKQGLSQFQKHIAGEEEGTTKPAQYSLVFDHFISTYLIKRMVNAFIELYPGHDFQTVATEITRKFRGIENNPLSIFPDTKHKFGDSDVPGNDVTLVDTGQQPLFR